MLRSVLIIAVVVLTVDGSVAFGDDKPLPRNTAIRMVGSERQDFPVLGGLHGLCAARVIVDQMVVGDGRETSCEGLTPLFQLELRKAGIVISPDLPFGDCIYLHLHMAIVEMVDGATIHYTMEGGEPAQIERNGVTWTVPLSYTWLGLGGQSSVGSLRDLRTKLRKLVVSNAVEFANEWLAANPPGQKKEPRTEHAPTEEPKQKAG